MARHPKESNLFFVMAAILLVFQVVLMATVNRPLNAAQSTHRLGDTRSNLDAYKYDRYISFGEMENRLQNLKAAYPNKLNVKVVGQSVEGRNIYLVTITDNMKRAEPAKANQPPYSNNIYRTHRRMPFNVLPRDDDDSNETPRNATYREIKPTIVVNQPKIAGLEKPVIFVDAGIHAREWVAPAAAFYLIDQLLITPSLTSDLEWRIIPMVNPDGYVYSQASIAVAVREKDSKSSNRRQVGIPVSSSSDSDATQKTLVRKKRKLIKRTGRLSPFPREVQVPSDSDSDAVQKTLIRKKRKLVKRSGRLSRENTLSNTDQRPITEKAVENEPKNIMKTNPVKKDQRPISEKAVENEPKNIMKTNPVKKVGASDDVIASTSSAVASLSHREGLFGGKTCVFKPMRKKACLDDDSKSRTNTTASRKQPNFEIVISDSNNEDENNRTVRRSKSKRDDAEDQERLRIELELFAADCDEQDKNN